MKRILQFFKRFFSKQFIHPEVNKPLASAIDDKIARHQKEAEKLMVGYREQMTGFVKTFFSKEYKTEAEQQIAYDTCNRAWQKLCRDVNSTSRHLNLDKKDFERQVKYLLRVNAAKNKEIKTN